MTPLDEHQLLIFWVQLAVLVATARGLGGLMRRIGQPAVVGELAAGLLIGPSILGRALPGVFAWLFPEDPVQSGLLLAVAWIGVAMLLVVTGFETDLALLRRLGRTSAFVSAGSLVIPLLLGFGLGLMFPAVFIGPEGDGLTFALFIAVALSISALPVVAKILLDMGLMRRNLGQVILAAAMANDLVGWILLGVIAGLVSSGQFDVTGLAVTLAAFAAFGVFALTVGQRLVDAALRQARAAREPLPRAVTVLVLVMLVAGAVTQAIGVEAVLGAFVTGILIGRSRYQPPPLGRTIDVVTNAFFAPVFFATAGLFVDLGALFDRTVALWTFVLIVVAGLAKLGGAWIGGAFGGMRRLEALAVGVGLNARGALEIVIATVGLGLGVLNQTSYTAVVVMAMATSIIAPPMLRRVLSMVGPDPDEASRLEREATLDRSVIAGTRHALVPTRGGINSLQGARLLDLCLPPDASVTVYAVHPGDEDPEDAVVDTDDVRRAFRRHVSERVERSSDDPAAAICAEARLGYGLVVLGMSERSPASGNGSVELSAMLRTILAECPVPMLLFRHAEGAPALIDEPRIRRILVPAVGTRLSQAAQEIAYLLADRVDAEVDALHVVNRPDTHDVWASDDGSAFAAVSAVLEEARSLANRYGREAGTVARSGVSVGQEIVASAEERHADLIVVGAQVRVSNGQPFLGHGVEYLIKHAPQTLLLVAFPADEAAERH